MRQICTVSRLAAFLSVVALSGVAAQTPDSGSVGRSAVKAPSPTSGVPAATQPGLPGAVPGNAASSGAPVTRLSTPVPTPVMPGPGGALPGNSPARMPLGQRPAAGATDGELAPANLPGSNSPAAFDSILPGAPGTGADLNAPVGASPSPLSEAPDSSVPGVEGVNAPGVGATPLLSQPAEPARPVPPTPVPVLPLSLIYGVILLLAVGYFWYTARRAQTEEGQSV